MSIDPYLDIIRKPMGSVHAAYVHPTSDNDSTGFARAFGFPIFSYGVAAVNFNRVRVNGSGDYCHSHASRLGTTVALYAAFERAFLPLFNHKLQFSYAFRNGIGLSSHVWNRTSNPDNELIGSALSIYFSAGLYSVYRTGNWRFRIGQELGHFSNGALARPNKGANYLNLDLSVAYLFAENTEDRFRPSVAGRPFTDKRFLLDITYHTGLKTSIGEWLVDRRRRSEGQPLKYGHYDLYVSHNVSAAFLYRYDRRFASGVGLDMFYEPYLNDIEIQNETNKAGIPKFSFGMSVRHRVSYKRMALNMSLGVYLARRFRRYANTDEEYGYYERIGLSYTPPVMHDCLSVGYDIHAHRTKAYASEITMGWQIPLGKRK